jgi:hypothetical protein
VPQKKEIFAARPLFLYDDGNWIQTGLDGLPKANSVLEKCHKNKALIPIPN